MMESQFEIQNGVLKRFHLVNSETEIVIPQGVTEIADNAFEHCMHLVSVEIPDGVTKIGNMAFHHSFKLTSVTMPDSVTSIGEYAFLFCQSLQSMHIPQNLEFVGMDAFFYCDKLRKRPLAVVEGKLLFEPVHRYYAHFYELERIFKNRDYTAKIMASVKYNIILQMYLADIDKDNTFAYIKKQFPKIFRTMINNDETELISAVIEDGAFLTKRNIDSLLAYAIEKGKTEIQLLLMNYKHDVLSYSDPFRKLKL